jgi:hypothetical protein
MTFVDLIRAWQFAASPPRQRPTSFGIGQVMQKRHMGAGFILAAWNVLDEGPSPGLLE